MIPPITDPLGKYWAQPPIDEILVDDHHALMTKETFRQLAEYSATNPSGVYDGKCWRRREANACAIRDWLVWYGPSKDPNLCSINMREIILVEL